MKTLFIKLKQRQDYGKSGFIFKTFFLIVGLLSLVWFLIRVIPKPQRASYPCMKATMPFAYSFVAYIISLGASFLFFRKAISSFRANQIRAGIFIIFLASMFAVWGLVQNNENVNATNLSTKLFSDPLGANSPIGTAKGIFPGRVVWVYDADATNISCTNSNKANAYFQDANTNQTAVDQMFSSGLLSITGQANHTAAWDTIFRFFNSNHGKGIVGYNSGETIFIKINAVSAWSGAGSTGEMSSGSGIEFDTSPQSLLALLRSLINHGGIPQGNIYLGDPMADVWNHVYDKLHSEFPNVKYVSQTNQTPGRYKLVESTDSGIHYSDKGNVMSVTTHNFYTEMMNADYLINVPSMKGHRWAGVTMFAKNFFGANTADHSWELHTGLMNPDNTPPLRDEYKMYRVMVDLMACKYLGGNTLLYFMDALWSTSYEHQKPEKFTTAPFNNDWCSSLFFSLDPVAIESVGIDLMQKEFTEVNTSSNPPRYTYVQWNAVDDYLHQAASSEWWPTGISYDPDNTGTPIGSLGVHEHWNNTTDMEYSRDLGTGQGIELVKIWEQVNATSLLGLTSGVDIYPNPCVGNATLQLSLDKESTVNVEVYSSNGDKMMYKKIDMLSSGEQEIPLSFDNLAKGVYYCRILVSAGQSENTFTKKIIIN